MTGGIGDVSRFTSRSHFASWNGAAPIDASSGDQNRHRLSRAGNRCINRVLHIMAVVQLRNDTEGRRYYRREVAGCHRVWRTGLAYLPPGAGRGCEHIGVAFCYRFAAATADGCERASHIRCSLWPVIWNTPPIHLSGRMSRPWGTPRLVAVKEFGHACRSPCLGGEHMAPEPILCRREPLRGSRGR
ncbi:IS110 family transposase [Actinoplanes sp. ATCC 53533]|uniref:IS110 family transposase n=1 Tax=Actinoplanes sp. ATCC 53533 TaxID=1288362 RepID=UPI001F19EE3D|nr:IS110 family transposase [Actinoplanes sp. ATCC 53533]